MAYSLTLAYYGWMDENVYYSYILIEQIFNLYNWNFLYRIEVLIIIENWYLEM